MSALMIIVIALLISVTAIIVLTRYLNLHAFFSLLIGAVICGFITGIKPLTIVELMQDGFGLILKQIGFLVALGSCLGMMMEKTGAMEVVSTKVVSWFGPKRSTLALSFTGLIVGIPVFCDSGFIILSRLIPSIAAQTSIRPAQLSLALSTGLYTTHTMVPPTPGPLSAAMNLGLSDDISLTMILGIVAAVPVGLVSYFLSKKLSVSITTNVQQHTPIATIHKISPVKAFLPLILPILLIAASSLPKVIYLPYTIKILLTNLGNPIVALSIGLILSLFLLLDVKKPDASSWMQEALKDAGIILLITGAGGAFGAIIKSSGLDNVLNEYVSGSSSQGVIFLLIGFVLAAALKTAQGSTTTSMVITSSLLVPLCSAADFRTATELSSLVIAIGGGAMVVSHANDSYFWVVSQFGGIAPKDAFRSFTLITLFQGLTAFAMSVIFYLLF